MRPITRDILLTLFLKSCLLTGLWWVCFKDVKKPVVNAQEWLFKKQLSRPSLYEPLRTKDQS